MARDRQAQIELIVEHYSHPRCRAKMDRPDVAMPGGNPSCGDLVTVYAKFETVPTEATERRLERASFLGSGCAISQAAASILMELVHERLPTIAELLEMSGEEMIEELGREVVETRPRCVTLALATLKAAARKYLRDETCRAAGLPLDLFAGQGHEVFEG